MCDRVQLFKVRFRNFFPCGLFAVVNAVSWLPRALEDLCHPGSVNLAIFRLFTSQQYSLEHLRDGRCCSRPGFAAMNNSE